MDVPTCVIYNPAAGRGRAERLLTELRQSLHAEVELRPTDRAGMPSNSRRRAADEGFAKIVAAGGDGTVHEVANGVLQSGRRDVVFSVWPLGSANDYAYSLGMDVWWKRRRERPPTETLEVDVGRVTAAGRETFFVCNLGVGFNGMVNGRGPEDALAARDAALRLGVPQGDGEALRHADDDHTLRRPGGDHADARPLGPERPARGELPAPAGCEPHRRSFRLHARDAAHAAAT